MRVPVWFEPTRLGTYEIACAQLCGIGHANMRGDVVVESPEAFEAWLALKAEEKAEEAEEDEEEEEEGEEEDEEEDEEEE